MSEPEMLPDPDDGVPVVDDAEPEDAEIEHVVAPDDLSDIPEVAVDLAEGES